MQQNRLTPLRCIFGAQNVSLLFCFVLLLKMYVFTRSHRRKVWGEHQEALDAWKHLRFCLNPQREKFKAIKPENLLHQFIESLNWFSLVEQDNMVVSETELVLEVGNLITSEHVNPMMGPHMILTHSPHSELATNHKVRTDSINWFKLKFDKRRKMIWGD